MTKHSNKKSPEPNGLYHCVFIPDGDYVVRFSKDEVNLWLSSLDQYMSDVDDVIIIKGNKLEIEKGGFKLIKG